MPTYLSTQHLMTTAPDPEVEAPPEFGWPEVRKGLHMIMGGYLVAVGVALLAVMAVAYIIYSVVTTHEIVETIFDAAMILYLTWAISILGSLYSLIMVVAGKVKCLLNAPERCGTKWLMFSAILLFLFGPALNITSNFVGVDRQSTAAQTKAVAAMMQGIHDYSEAMAKMRPRAYISLAGNLSSVASTVLFIVFLRQVARCFDDGPRMRLAEFYLLFNALVLAGTLYLGYRLFQLLKDIPLPAPGALAQFDLPPALMREFQTLPIALLMLGACWLVSLLWYFGLIISTSRGIAQGIGIQEAALHLKGLR
jgi:hypothetical protein